ncbi:SprT-like domain-containing protein [Parasediminibacterium sp. JCM 36343]|uniref:SprT-like domain-containing protein n=1 Tax=Parasediminibacterium sp. JCM 36343 TaxID=3374279 RepID=UPI003979D87E
MAATEHPMHALAAYLPDNAFEPVVHYVHHYKIHLTVTRKRRSVLGDYRHAAGWGNHKISINGNLNKYEFLITFLHELAHLFTFEQYQNKVDPHGTEWKNHYSLLLQDFVAKKIFPPDVEKALQQSIKNPAATASGETALLMVLRNYNTQQRPGFVIIDKVPNGANFITENGRLFKKIGKRRKRYECIEMETGRHYSFSGLAEVKLME